MNARHSKSINSAIAQLEVNTEATNLIKEIDLALTKDDVRSDLGTRNSPHWYPGAPVRYLNQVVSDAECLFERLTAHLRERKRKQDASYFRLKRRIDIIGARVYYELWQASLTDAEAELYNQLIVSTKAKCVVWEGVPAPWRAAASYDRLQMNETGLFLFVHCCGFTFCEYKEGVMTGQNARFVPLEQVALAVCAAKDNIETAIELLNNI